MFRDCSVGKADLKQELARVIDDWGWQGTIDELLEYWFTKGTQVDDEVVEYVKFIRDKGVRCFLATDQEKYRGEHLRQTLGGGKVFEEIFYSAAIGHSKKTEAFWDVALERFDLDRSQVLLIDDDQEKIHAVASFGIDTYLYTDLKSLKKYLLNYV